MEYKYKPVGWVTTISELGAMPRDMWNTVMTIENSPLKNFDPMVAHMIFQVLAFIWSGIFAAMLGSYIAFGVSAFLHAMFISGVVITAVTFRQAEKAKPNFNLRPGYHSVSRTRQTMWIHGELIELSSKDPGGEHE